MSAVNPVPTLSPSSSILTNGLSPSIHQNPVSSDLLQKWIFSAAKVGEHPHPHDTHLKHATIMCMKDKCQITMQKEKPLNLQKCSNVKYLFL